MTGVIRRNGRPTYFAYKAVLYGHVSGPIVWARIAAAALRAAAGLLPEPLASLQCYVDDPRLAAAGDEDTQTLMVKVAPRRPYKHFQGIRSTASLTRFVSISWQLALARGIVHTDNFYKM